MPIIDIPDPCSPCKKEPDPCCEPKPCEPCDPCKAPACPIQLDTTCLIYNKYGQGESKLQNLQLPNGSNGKDIFDKIDQLLGENIPFNFETYDLSCLANQYVIENFQDFVESVSKEICTINEIIQSNYDILFVLISDLEIKVDDINNPEIIDGGSLQILQTDDLEQIIYKLKDGYYILESLIGGLGANPDFSPSNSSSISWIIGGTKGHQPTASVKKSPNPGNALQILANGLFVPPGNNNIQVLGYIPNTKTITLSGGGGQVILPPDKDEQTLSLNNVTKVLTISNGNSVNLSNILPNFIQVPITPNSTNSIQLLANGPANTNITANVKVSACVDNLLSINPDGLCVTPPAIPPPPDEKVRATNGGLISGFLDEKLEGCTNGALTTNIAYNNVTDRVTVCGTINLVPLLTAISASPAALSAFCAMVEGCLCFSFKVRNTGVINQSYDYTDCDGLAVNGTVLAPAEYHEICARSVSPSIGNDPDTIQISNSGYCNV